MAKGRKTGGRKKGSTNRPKVPPELIAAGSSPLETLLAVMRDENQPMGLRVSCAKDAAPYIHPRLTAVELSGPNKGPIEVNVVRFSDPPQSVDSPQVSNAGVDRP